VFLNAPTLETKAKHPGEPKQNIWPFV